ncbi:hypothetical protein EBU71_20680, partial [bacterium]|nr:hypothetical protein [Candidatus Elulimicrobium humile]
MGEFYIRATTVQSDNYNQAGITSLRVTVNTLNTPDIIFPTNPPPIQTITYGQTYTLPQAFFESPTAEIIRTLVPELNINYSIRSNGNPSGNASTVAQIVAPVIPSSIPTVRILSAGTFFIIAQTNIIQNIFQTTFRYLSVTVNRATPTITFPNNIIPGIDTFIVGRSYEFLAATVTIPAGL